MLLIGTCNNTGREREESILGEVKAGAKRRVAYEGEIDCEQTEKRVEQRGREGVEEDEEKRQLLCELDGTEPVQEEGEEPAAERRVDEREEEEAALIGEALVAAEQVQPELREDVEEQQREQTHEEHSEPGVHRHQDPGLDGHS